MATKALGGPAGLMEPPSPMVPPTIDNHCSNTGYSHSPASQAHPHTLGPHWE